ncbi:phospholipase D [Musa troglodytarum]|uniref:Phospholipase n=1 Tax=Musa troglodytarum TaxID=320322 RepID=A0A9E7HRP2_9LILI|nr:phospholipase D [Musa troglodytarum]
MSDYRFMSEDGHCYVRLPSAPAITERQQWIFDELPTAKIVAASRPDAGDITPLLLSYTIEFQYKQVFIDLMFRLIFFPFSECLVLGSVNCFRHNCKWAFLRWEKLLSVNDGNLCLQCWLRTVPTSAVSLDYIQFRWHLLKKASQVLYLHLALKKRAFLEELHDKQEQVKEWLHNLGLGENIPTVQDDDEADDVSVPLPHEDNSSVKSRNIPSSAALPIIRPSLGGQQLISDKAKLAMQGYLDHFFSNLDIVNSQEVWAVLKPGFLALLENPFDTKILDIIVFDVLPYSNGNDDGQILLAQETKERNPLCFGFQVFGGSRTTKLRIRNNTKIKEWVAAINDAGLRSPEGWCYPHRFGSFAPPRGLTEDETYVQWFVDGQAAFEAIASSIEQAKSEIYITDWWLCPELHLRRPFSLHGFSRLDAMLEAKAKQGVQIYILLYKEVPLALKINSVYSKRILLNIHENIKVLRYPDHLSTGIYLWSHHEKIVTIDNQISFIGGLDLCFGRYDNFEHKVGDMPPLIWPGKDYYNPRESEPNSWEDTMKDELDRGKYPRMPWHDVQCALWGPPCHDVARHFVQRWNYAKRSKAPNEKTIPLLIPQHHMVIPHYMGSREMNHQNDEQNAIPEDVEKHTFSRSCQDIPLLLPHEPDGTATTNSDKVHGLDRICGLSEHPNKNSQSQPVSLIKTKIEHSVQDMQMKGFIDDYSYPRTQREQDCNMFTQPPIQNADWWETHERSSQVVSTDESRQVGPRTPCRCQVIRSVSQWSAGTSQTEESIHKAYVHLIDKAEYFLYIENQFFISGLSGDDTIRNRVLEALYQRIIRAEKEKKCFRVIIVLPLLPGFQGGIDDGGSASVRAIMHWQYRTICRGSKSILQKLLDTIGPRAHDFISFYGLRTYGRLFDGGPLVTNQVYVHSKLMIIDDREVLIGSANINDRSLLGSRDSEIGILIEDKEYVDSFMNGKPWKAGKFSLSLRLSLWLEHLGLHAGEISKIRDPINNAAYKDIWMATAETNTIIYQEVFSCVPNDLIHCGATFRESTNYFKEKFGYTTTDLGISPEKKDPEHKEHKGTDPIQRLESVRGHLVSFPLQFMCSEDLRPVFSQGEFYVWPLVFL